MVRKRFGSSGSIDCGGSCEVSGDVKGDIDAGGSETCGNVSGDIDARSTGLTMSLKTGITVKTVMSCAACKGGDE